MSVSRVYRLLRMITMLQGSRNYTAGELAEELQVSRRTIFRDLNMLEMAHIPYYFDSESGGYRIGRHFFLPPINLTLPEALAMLILAGRLRGGHQVPLLAHGARAAVKLESALPPSIARHVGSVVDGMQVSLPPASRHEGTDTLFEEIAAAIAEKNVCRMVYISFHEHRQIVTDVHPLRLIFQHRGWYMIAYSTKHAEVRTFKLGRIRKLTVTQRKFVPPADVDWDQCFGDAWNMIPEGKLHDVHLHFEPDIAANVAEVRWHRSQRVEWNDDGSIEFHARVDGLGEISWWILGYGDRVKVVGPASLARQVADVAARTLKQYRKRGR